MCVKKPILCMYIYIIALKRKEIKYIANIYLALFYKYMDESNYNTIKNVQIYELYSKPSYFTFSSYRMS